MPKYFDSRGVEIVDKIDEITGDVIDARSSWLMYWTALVHKGITYDKVYKIRDTSIELKSYSRSKNSIPYKVAVGFRLEVSEDGKTSSIINKATEKVVISKVISDEEFEQKKIRSRRETRKKFIDIALANKWTHFATLTFSSEMSGISENAHYNYKDAKKAFMVWRKSVVKKFGCDFKYMAVAEFGGKNGRIHWHALLYFDESVHFEQATSTNGKKLFLMNSQNRNVIDENGRSIPKLVLPNWKYGITDFQPIYNSKDRAVYYIAKYLSKDEEMPFQQQGSNAKSYLASQGLNRPQKEYLSNNQESSLLSKDTQQKLENAPPVFKLLDAGQELLRKTEAIVDPVGTAHALNKELAVIDISKKSHQPTTNQPDDPY